MINSNRIIDRYGGTEKGPLFICIGGIHGNEKSGVQAQEQVFQMLKAEQVKKNDFIFRGKMIGLRGNIAALKAGVRFVDKDLNRSFRPEIIEKTQKLSYHELDSEEKEIKDLLGVIEQEIRWYDPEEVFVLDLHTTTASGGIFMIPSTNDDSLNLARQFPVPVILGAIEGLQGSTMHYFNTRNLGVKTTAVTFEAGQHHDPLSVNRAIAVIIHCLKLIGCVDPKDVENRHNEILLKYSKGLPQMTELIKVHTIKPEDKFHMMPGFRNFHQVAKGTLLARDKNGPIYAPEDGYILMPLYQKQGDDGFFLFREVQEALIQ